MKEKCGIYGIYSKSYNKNIIIDTICGLELLQHRGQEGCGLAYLDDNRKYNLSKGAGLVKDVFNKNNFKVNSNMVIGHVRYSTSGQSKIKDSSVYDECQPLFGKCNLGSFYLAHNGNIPNLSIHDTQYIIQFLEKDISNTWRQKLISLLETIPCAYCLLIITKDCIYALRDRFGIRPLCIGINEDKYCVTSETCALDKYNFLKNVNPGEIIQLSNSGVDSIYFSYKSKLSICSFEFIYFLNINSICDNYAVKDVRSKLAIKLAQKETLSNINDYIVVGIPESGIYYGKEYANYLNLNYSQFIKKNKKINRTFILPSDEERNNACLKKFIYDFENLKNKKLIIIDDSIVRGNIIRAVIKKLWECNVNEIHIRIPCAPVIDRCRLGIDIPNRNELLAYNRSIEDIKNKLNINSIQYLTYNEMSDILPENSNKECFGEKLTSNMLLTKNKSLILLE
tara:strand:- start:375 stop:1733 length:1359 start_codon:yes stop_codon:yes gene_type:complete